ncbi:MAG: response regulator transcription factor [Bacillota bacterium]|nr:response regulator transcription factor [Bacillota bacterium]
MNPTAAEQPCSGPLILVVDDEEAIRDLLRLTLEAHGYRAATASTGGQALTLLSALHPDLVLLDLALPDMDGVEVLRRLRTWCPAPVLILSVRTQEAEKIEALDAGADDYLTKPFASGELLARIRAALRRLSPAARQGRLEVGDLVVDLQARAVEVAGRPVHLTPIEYELLKLLALHAGQVVTHRQLLRAVWGPGYERETHYLRVYVAQLRRKLEPYPERPRRILNEPGVGYRLVDGG